MAFFKGSAYETTPLFGPRADGSVPFRGLRARALRSPAPVLEHTVAAKERLDSLAQAYYAESRDWRWLVEANVDVLFPEDLLWTTQAPQDPGADTMGSERVGQVIIVPRRTEGG